MSVPGLRGFVLALLLVACGNASRSSPSTAAGAAGDAAGGAAGTPSGDGAPSAGGALAASGAASGGMADGVPALHHCLDIRNDAVCPEQVLTASIGPFGSSDLDPASLEGVTDLDGDLDIEDDNAAVLAALGCLRRVSGHVSVKSDQVTSLWPLRHLEEVAYGVIGAGLSLQGKQLRQDCGLIGLKRVGVAAQGFRGAAIDLDSTATADFELSSLEQIQHLRIQRNSQLKRIYLPSSLPLLDGQLWINDNAVLEELYGLESATLSLDTNKFGTLPQYQFQSNPQFPSCFAEKLRTRLVSLGADPADFVISGNASTCPI